MHRCVAWILIFCEIIGSLLSHWNQVHVLTKQYDICSKSTLNLLNLSFVFVVNDETKQAVSQLSTATDKTSVWVIDFAFFLNCLLFLLIWPYCSENITPFFIFNIASTQVSFMQTALLWYLNILSIQSYPHSMQKFLHCLFVKLSMFLVETVNKIKHDSNPRLLGEIVL